MAINTDGPKKQGRFLKKNSKILKSVAMVEFNFEEICNHNIVGFDNPDRSIIYTRFHDPKMLEAVVKTHQTMNDVVLDPSQPNLGVIFPADFTQDWHNERMNSKRRAMGFDDEDEIDFAEVARSRMQIQPRTTSPSVENILGQSAPTNKVDQANVSVETPKVTAHPAPPSSIRAPEVDGKVQSMSENDMASAIQKAFTPPLQQETSNTTSKSDGTEDQSFTPLQTGSSAGETVAPEDLAIESWKNKQFVAKHNAQMLEELRAEARSEGYQAGFREGEEKGMLSGEQNAVQVFSKVTEILHEFEGLKELILGNVQKNFYELSQAIGEALLGREFSIRPEAYAAMIQRVLKDTLTQDEFKIRMHPDTWQKVHNLGISDLEGHLLKDPSIPLGDFRIDSAMSVVDINVKKLVTQLLEKSDINLFDEKKAV